MTVAFAAGELDSFVRTAENPLSDSDAWAGAWTNALKTNGTQALATVADRQFSGGIWATAYALPVQFFVTLDAFGGTDVVYLGWLDDPDDPVYGYVLTVQSTGESAPTCNWSIGSLAGGTCTVAAGDSIGMQIDAAGVITAWTERSGVWTLVGTAVDTTYDTNTFWPGPGYPSLGTLCSEVRFSAFSGGTIEPLLPVALSDAAATVTMKVSQGMSPAAGGGAALAATVRSKKPFTATGGGSAAATVTVTNP